MFVQSQQAFGADSQVHATLIEALKSRFDIHVACNAGSARDSEALAKFSGISGITVLPSGFGPTFTYQSRLRKLIGAFQLPSVLTASWRLLRYTRRSQVRIVHCTEKPRDCLYGLILQRFAGARLVVHLHVGYAPYFSRVTRKAVRDADAVIAISDFVKRTVLESGARDSGVHVVPNALSPEPWLSEKDARDGTRRSLAIRDDQVVITVAARLFRWKGQDFLVRAAAELVGEFPSLVVLIVGGDDSAAHPGTLPFSAELLELARELGVEANVRLLGVRRDMPAIYDATDVFCLPSTEEPFGMVFLEAMARQRPVVAFASGGAPEVVEDGVVGKLATPLDVASLAAALRPLLRDPGLRRTMGEAGLLRVRTKFLPGQVAPLVAQLYEQLADS